LLKTEAGDGVRCSRAPYRDENEEIKVTLETSWEGGRRMISAALEAEVLEYVERQAR
jgi:hypothetical protein